MGCASSAPLAASPLNEKKQDETFFGTFVLGPRLGKGSFGQVHKASLRASKERQWAVKLLDMRDNDVQARQYALEEVNTWKQAGNHKNVLTLAGAAFERGLCLIVMECCETSLQRFLEAGAGEGKLTERAVSNVVQQTLEACAHIHERRVVHRDIKPENLLINKGIVKLIDFGLATVLPTGCKVKGVNGTPAFMAPEMVKKEAYDTSVDVWAVGVMVYALLFGEYPYFGQKRSGDAMKEAIRSGARPPPFQPSKGDFPRSDHHVAARLPSVSHDGIAFTKALLTREAAQRPDANAASRFDFLRLRKPLSELQDLSSTFASAVAAGACGRQEKQMAETALDHYISDMKGWCSASRSISILRWDLQAAEFQEGCAPSPDALALEIVAAKMETQGCEPPTPSTVADPWCDSGVPSEHTFETTNV